MRAVGRSARPAECDEQEYFVACAQECAASASIDADPVTTAATDFATATRRLAAKAMRTVVRLAEPAARR
jgi:hypothetical protein